MFSSTNTGSYTRQSISSNIYQHNALNTNYLGLYQTKTVPLKNDKFHCFFSKTEQI